MKYLVIGSVLLVLAIQDARTKTVSIGWILLLAACSVGLEYGNPIQVEGNLGIEFVIGCLPGVTLLLLGWVMPRQIGLGDGLILMALGAGIGLQHMLIILLFESLFLSSFLALALALKVQSADARYPMIPCLFLGYVTDILWCV